MATPAHILPEVGVPGESTAKVPLNLHQRVVISIHGNQVMVLDLEVGILRQGVFFEGGSGFLVPTASLCAEHWELGVFGALTVTLAIFYLFRQDNSFNLVTFPFWLFLGQFQYRLRSPEATPETRKVVNNAFLSLRRLRRRRFLLFFNLVVPVDFGCIPILVNLLLLYLLSLP